VYITEFEVKPFQLHPPPPPANIGETSFYNKERNALLLCLFMEVEKGVELAFIDTLTEVFQK
jgi:hypothetical protein